MSSVKLRTIEPAAFSIDERIKTIATLNRSKGTHTGEMAAEGIITGEYTGQDGETARHAITGLTEGLSRTPRFSVKQTQLEMHTNAGLHYPTPLDWTQAHKICTDYGADAIASLEILDTDHTLHPSTTRDKKKNKEGKEMMVTTFHQDRHITVKLGWRLYDDVNRKIIDEFMVEEVKSWQSSGHSEKEALSNLPDDRTCTLETARLAGLKYAARISPTWTSLARSYYIRGDANMKRAARYVRSDKWDDAARIWQAMLNNKMTKEKILGRAAYNLAVANEVENKLDSALQWAEKSYSEFGCKKAKEYIDQLKHQIDDAGRVKKQMGNK